MLQMEFTKWKNLRVVQRGIDKLVEFLPY